MVYKDPDYQANYRAKYNEHRQQNAYDSIVIGKIIDQKKWDAYCNKLKNHAPKHPYSNNFTNEIMFEMMVQGCFYCDDIATTIDRIDSKLDHTPENCVGSCWGCNNSKGSADPDTFIRKAYYRARRTYYDDDTDIWFEYKTKPYTSSYNKKKVPFELTEDEWEKLVVGKCAYCHRSPITWFGVDRIDPSRGYISDNIVSSCFDCNLDKLEDDVDTMRARNERIAQRMDDGELVIGGHEKVILHKGTHPSSKIVCARGKVYESISVATRATKMNQVTFRRRISDGKDPEIFVATKEFYEEYKDSIEDITKNMFVVFDHFYTNI